MKKHYFYWNSSGAFHDKDSSSFSIAFKLHVIGLSFEVYKSFLPQLATKWRAVESGSPEKVPGKGAFCYINDHNLGTFSGLTDSTARNFEASRGWKELYTSKESPIARHLKKVLKLEKYLS